MTALRFVIPGVGVVSGEFNGTYDEAKELMAVNGEVEVKDTEGQRATYYRPHVAVMVTNGAQTIKRMPAGMIFTPPGAGHG